MEDKLTAAIAAYAVAQSKVLDRVFANIRQTGTPSSVGLAFCLPDDVIAGMPEKARYDAFLRKLSFLGYAMWKSTCYRQVREHDAFETERARLIERFPDLDRWFLEGVGDGHGSSSPSVGMNCSPDQISADVTENGCTMLRLQMPGSRPTSLAGGSREPQAGHHPPPPDCVRLRSRVEMRPVPTAKVEGEPR